MKRKGINLNGSMYACKSTSPELLSPLEPRLVGMTVGSYRASKSFNSVSIFRNAPKPALVHKKAASGPMFTALGIIQQTTMEHIDSTHSEPAIARGMPRRTGFVPGTNLYSVVGPSFAGG